MRHALIFLSTATLLWVQTVAFLIVSNVSVPDGLLVLVACALVLTVCIMSLALAARLLRPGWMAVFAVLMPPAVLSTCGLYGLDFLAAGQLPVVMVVAPLTLPTVLALFCALLLHPASPTLAVPAERRMTSPTRAA